MLIEERLARLERSARLWRAGALTGLLAFVAAVGLGAGATGEPPKFERVLRAELIQLVDQDGAVRAALGTSDGVSSLYLFDSKGRARASFGTGSDGEATLLLMDKEQRGRLLMSTHEGAVSLQLGDGEGRPRFKCFANSDGTSSLIFQEDNKSQRFLVGIVPDGRTFAAMKVGERIIWSAP